MSEEMNTKETVTQKTDVPESGSYDYASVAGETMTEVKERVGRGILGALIGALIGAVCIVLVDQLGYVASISGVVMGACTWYISATGSVMRLQLPRCMKRISCPASLQYRN